MSITHVKALYRDWTDLTITQRLSPPFDEAIFVLTNEQAYSNLFPNSFKLVFKCFRMKFLSPKNIEL
jgi:hypothetical protein